MDIFGYFQRPEDAQAAAADLAGVAARPRVTDAGMVEDMRSFAIVGRGLVGGGAAGAIVGVVGGAALIPFVGSEFPIVMAMAGIAVGAFGALAGGLSASALAEGRRSSGQGLVVEVDVDPARADEVESSFTRHGAALVERRDRSRRNWAALGGRPLA